jgi:hypothetical protein
MFSQSFDAKYGGFGHSPKFPTPHNLLFLLRCNHFKEHERLTNMVEKTLEQMYRGGIWDHIGYGFSRYSTDQKWLVPHFEKMLYDNALLTIAYLETFQVTGKNRNNFIVVPGAGGAPGAPFSPNDFGLIPPKTDFETGLFSIFTAGNFGSDIAFWVDDDISVAGENSDGGLGDSMRSGKDDQDVCFVFAVFAFRCAFFTTSLANSFYVLND